MSVASSPAPGRSHAPEVIVAAGCLIALITFGPRASAGLFQIPMTVEFGWGRDTFGLALAIQNLLWGLGAPFAGAIADRFGIVKVFCAGALLYAAGLVVMALATTPLQLHFGAGVLIGFGLSACSFNLVLAAFGKLLPESWRPMAMGRFPPTVWTAMSAPGDSLVSIASLCGTTRAMSWGSGPLCESCGTREPPARSKTGRPSN